MVKSGIAAPRRLRVLVVDDKPRARQSLKALLATSPHVAEILEASDGEQACERIEVDRPDVILMDARMPRLGGIEATQRIQKRWEGLPVIVLSMYPEYEAPALEAGAYGFVSKGEPLERLMALLVALAEGDQG
ncbi:MAG TPA: response regulator transcription factor [Anaerolineales bacterium]|nr:response regulator transcription factor [Anaerolineales bacterium]